MELPLAQISPQGSPKTPTPTFTTFQPVDSTRTRCRGLLKEPRLQALQAEGAQFSPRAPPSPPARGAASRPEDPGKAEEVPTEGGQALQAQTRAWFQETQAQGLLQHGAAPPWFHGFITRREAERLLETEPQGRYLVRFSESAVTFVLTYRSRTCCRHFLLAQRRDGRHVVLGEERAHARLQDLLRHHARCPLSPYGETLGRPLARQTPEPAGLSLRTEDSDAGSKSQDPHPQYSSVLRKEKPAALTQKEGGSEPKEPPRPKPLVPAKPLLSAAEAYTSPAPRPGPALPSKPCHPIYQEPDEPIAFYAMGRGSPGEAPSNIYAEVEMEVEMEVGVPSGDEDPPGTLWHSALRKCWSRPVPGSQNPGGQQLHSENSAAGQGPPVPRQPLPLWGHSLPHHLDRGTRTEERRGPP